MYENQGLNLDAPLIESLLKAHFLIWYNL